MSLFNFVKNAGAKLFGGGKSEPEALQEHVKSLGVQTGDGVQVDYSDGKVTASGTVTSQAEKEKILLALGNVEGVEVIDESIQVAESSEPESTFHTVERGDTLSAIAKKYYGNASLYNQIFEANRPLLEHPDRIYPGQVLRIPPKD